MVDYRMKAEGAGQALNSYVEQLPPRLSATVGGLRAALAELPAEMVVRVMVQGSDTGVCALVNLDAKAETNELMIIGERVPAGGLSQ